MPKKEIYLFLSAEGMPEDTETFTLSIDNIYGIPWDIYTLDINGEGERVPGEFQPFSLEFGTGFVTYECGAYIRIVAPGAWTESVT